MAFITINGRSPADHGAAFVAENATLAGCVRLAKESSVWYGAVLRADTGCITIGENTNVQDNAVLHTGPGLDVKVGKGVSIGHGAIVHGCTVGDHCLIGMHATILNGAVIGDGCLIAAGALVPEGTVIPAGRLVFGVPGTVVRPGSAEQAAGQSSGRRGGVKTPPYKATSQGVPTAKLRAGHVRPLQSKKKCCDPLRKAALFILRITLAPHPDLRW